MSDTEYALMIDWEDGHPVEYVPATSVKHAEEMARKLYAGRLVHVVQRPVAPWTFLDSDVLAAS